MPVEVRTLSAVGRELAGFAWVMIQKKGDAYFLVGVANGIVMNPHVAPTGFSRPEDVIRAAVVWAEYLEAPILFITDRS